MSQGRVSFRDVLSVPEFRWLWVADVQSAVGDQLSRVALSVLVFHQTHSAVLTALTYALTFLPAMIGGALLSGIADRLPRRKVMVGCDLIRAALLGLMAVPHSPVWVLFVLLTISVLLGSPFAAAESALIPDILDGERYVVGSGLRTITNQLAQLAGFAGGGFAVATVGPRGGLALDAVTFALSAGLVLWGVRPRPAPAPTVVHGLRGYFATIAAGLGLVAGHRRLRTLLGFSWLLGLFVVPEGIATPYASEIHAGSRGVGLLLAAAPAGTAIGTYLFVRFVPAHRRTEWIGPLTVLCGLPLILCALHPGLVVSLLLWALSGACCAYQVQVVAEYVRTVPAGQRGQAVGVAGSGLLAAQGVGILLGGLVAEAAGPSIAVASAGGLATVLAGLVTVSWNRIARKTVLELGA